MPVPEVSSVGPVALEGCSWQVVTIAAIPPVFGVLVTLAIPGSLANWLGKKIMSQGTSPSLELPWGRSIAWGTIIAAFRVNALDT